MHSSRKAPTGILGFPVAPFDENGKLDEKALAVNIRFLLEEGLEAIFIACGSGEFQSLSKEEYEIMIDVAIQETDGKVPVYTGVGGNIQDALSYARISENKKADGFLVLPPYLAEGEQEGLYDYLYQVISETSLNAIVYQRNNAILQLSTLEKLLDLEQLVGLKDGVGNMELNICLTNRFGNRLSWLNGMPMAEVTMPAYIPLGFDSYSSAISNYIPHISRQFYHALLQGNSEMVHEIYKDIILPINEIRKQRKGYAVSLIKAGMELTGLPVKNRVRAPFTPVEPEHYKQLESILQLAKEKYPKKQKMVRG